MFIFIATLILNFRFGFENDIFEQPTVKYIFRSMQEVANFGDYLKKNFRAYFKLVKLLKLCRKNYRKNQKQLTKNNFPYFFEVANIENNVKYYFPLYYKLANVLILFSH